MGGWIARGIFGWVIGSMSDGKDGWMLEWKFWLDECVSVLLVEWMDV